MIFNGKAHGKMLNAVARDLPFFNIVIEIGPWDAEIRVGLSNPGITSHAQGPPRQAFKTAAPCHQDLVAELGGSVNPPGDAVLLEF